MEGGGFRRRACAKCQTQKSKCGEGCIFAPYFPPDQPERFTQVHEVFSAKNVQKMLEDLHEDQRAEAVTSVVYEAKVRLEDPVHGCYGEVMTLKHLVDVLWEQQTALMREVQMFRDLGLALMREVQMLQRQRTTLIGEVGEVHMLQSQLNYRNDEVEQLKVVPQAALSNCNPSPASLSNSGLPR